MDEVERAVTNVTNVYPYDCRCNNQYANDDLEPCLPLEKISHLKLANRYMMRTVSVSRRVWDTRLGVSQCVEYRAYRYGGCHGIASAPVVFEEDFQCRNMMERYNYYGKFKSLMCVNFVQEQPWPEDT